MANLSAIDTRLAEAYQKKCDLEELRRQALAFVADGDSRVQIAANLLAEAIAGLNFAINSLLKFRGQLDPELRAWLGLSFSATDDEVKEALQPLVEG